MPETIWDLLKNSYSSEGSPSEKDAMTDLIDNFMLPLDNQNIASFQDYSEMPLQHITDNITTANSLWTNYSVFHMRQLQGWMQQIEAGSGCLTDPEKIEILLQMYRAERKTGIEGLIKLLLENPATDTFKKISEMAEADLIAAIASLPCTDNYTRGQGESFLNDVRSTLGQNTFTFVLNGIVEPGTPGEESMEEMAISSTLYSAFANYSFQIVNTTFTSSKQVQNTVCISPQGTFSSNFSLVNESTIPPTIQLTGNLLNNIGGIIATTPITVAPQNPAPVIIPLLPVPTPIPPIPPDPTVYLTVLNAERDNIYNSDFLDELFDTLHIETLEDVRRAGGLKHLDYTDFVYKPTSLEIEEIDSFASLDKMYPNDVKVINNLYITYSGINATQIAASPRSTFVNNSNPDAALPEDKAGFISAGQAFVTNKTSEKYVQNIGTGVLSDYSQYGLDSLVYLSPETREKIKTIFAEKCTCDDCEAATSPIAYLSELINYVVSYIKHNGSVTTLDFLEETFCQPFGSAISDCTSMTEKVCYARISIEILRQYYIENGIPFPGGLTTAIQAYCQEAYLLLLTSNGINYSDLTLMKDAAPEKRKKYTESLGLYYDESVPPTSDILNTLWRKLNDSATPIPESYLEQTFGLQDTTRDGASTGLKIGDSTGALEQWNFDGFEFLYNTDIHGNVYLTITFASGVYTVSVFKDQGKTILVAQGTATSITSNIALLETNLSGLSGWVRIVNTTTDTITVSLIPLIICSRIQYTKEGWKTTDANAEDPVINPDIMTLKDIRNPYDIAILNAPANIWDMRRDLLATKSSDILTNIEIWAPFFYGPWAGATCMGIVTHKQDDQQFYISLHSSNIIQKHDRVTFALVDEEPVSSAYGSLYYNNERKELFLFNVPPATAPYSITKYNPDTLTKEWSLGPEVFPMQLNGMCEDDRGNLIIADTGNNRILKLTPSTIWGVADDVHFSKTHYYLLEKDYARVAKYNLAGDRIMTFGYNFENKQVAEWLFDNNLNDPHGNTSQGYNLLYVESPEIHKYALSLNGFNAYVNIDSASNIDSNAAGYIERSIKVRFLVENKEIGQCKQVLFAQGSDEKGFNIYLYGGRLYAGIWNGSTWEEFVSTDALKNKHWHELVVSVKGNSLSGEPYKDGFRLYIDGAIVASGNGYKIESSTSTSYSKVTIGAAKKSRFHDGKQQADVVSNYFMGELDELFIWNKSLFDQEVQMMYEDNLNSEAELSNPSRVWVDDSENVYVLNATVKKLQHFASTGDLLYIVDLGSIETPVDFAVDEEKNVIILNGATAGGLFKYNFSTATLAAIPDIALVQAKAIVRNVDKHYYIIDNNGLRLSLVKADFSGVVNYTTYVCDYPTSWKNQNSPDGFNNLVSLCNDVDGNIIVVDAGYNRIVTLKVNTTDWTIKHICTWGKNNSTFSSYPNPIFQLTALSEVSIDLYGNLYLKCQSTQNSQIGLHRLAMPLMWGTIDNADPYYRLQSPMGVDVDENGFIYVVNAFESDIIKVYNNYGKIEGVPTPTIVIPETTIDTLKPKIIRVDRLGNIYLYMDATAGPGNKIYQISTSGTLLKYWADFDIGGSRPIGELRSLWVDYQYGQIFFTTTTTSSAVGINTYNKLGMCISDELDIPMNKFLYLDIERKRREDITPTLDELKLTLESFRFLISLANSPLQPGLTNITDYANILTNSYKEGLYADWKTEEQSNGIYLTPDLFINQKAYEQDDFEVTPWRATERERNDWLNRLNRRTTTLNSLDTANKNLLNDTEDQTLYALRDALILYSDTTSEPLAEKARLLSAKLFHDFEMNCCQKTTRLTQSIETLQLLVWGIRNGQISDGYPSDTFMIDNDRFDDEWKWLGSYATWRSALMVFVYPENILEPSLRKLQTARFREVSSLINDNTGFTPKDAVSVASKYQQYVEDILGLSLEDAVDVNLVDDVWDGKREVTTLSSKRATFVFGVGPATNSIYYSIQFYDDGGDKSKALWQPIPGAENINKFVGAKQFTFGQSRKLFVFYTIYEEKAKKVLFASFDLDNGSWDGEPKEMGDLADSPTEFDITMVKHDDQYIKPGFFVNYFGFASRYFVYCHMAIDGSGFDDNAYYDVQTAENTDPNSKLKGSIRGGVAYSSSGPGNSGVIVKTYLIYGVSNTVPGSNSVTECFTEVILGYSGIIKYWGKVSTVITLSTASDAASKLAGAFWNARSGKFVVIMNIKSAINSFEVLTALTPTVTNSIPKSLKYLLPSCESPRPDQESYRFVYKNDSYYDKLIRIGHVNIGTGTTTLNLKPETISQITPMIPSKLKVELLRNPVNLQTKRALISNAYTRYNDKVEEAVMVPIEEAFFHVPMVIANALRKNKFYTESLDWYRTVFNFSESTPQTRKIFYGLIVDENIASELVRPDEWLSDPLNPHAVAKTRPRTYTKYTLFSIVNCLLDYADAEFTKDNVESLARARELYETALQILADEGLLQTADECAVYIKENLTYTVTDPDWVPVWDDIYSDLYEIHDKHELETTITQLNALTGVGTIETQLKSARGYVNNAIEKGKGIKTTEEVVTSYNDLTYEVNTVLLGEPLLYDAAVMLQNAVKNNFYSNMEQATAVSYPSLVSVDNKTKFDWLRDFPVLNPIADGPLVYVNNFAEEMLINVDLSKQINWHTITAETLPASFQLYANNPTYYAYKDDRSPYLPGTVYQFCMPKNPLREILVLRAELNLYKLRNCMNIGGMTRELSPFAAATDTTTGMPSIGDNGTLVIPGLGAPLPTIYRYSTLIERAKQLTNIAQQSESFYLSLLEKTDSESQQLMQAKQTIKVAEQTVKLQDLRINEAQENINLTDLQIDRAQYGFDYYSDLLSVGLTGLETSILGIKSLIGTKLAAAEIFGKYGIIEEAAMLGVGGKFGNIASATRESINATINLMNGEIDLLSTLASNQRRQQEWEFQKGLASKDVGIAKQQKVIAQAQMKVVSQEHKIADIQHQQASDTLEFLQNKFTNRELYVYMSKIAGDVFLYFLTRATAMAKLAQTQLAFERQITPPSFILDDYYADVSSGPTLGVSTDAEYRGMTGSSRLLKDIYRLDEYAFEKDVRRLEISKTLSIGRLYPELLQNLRNTGQMTFSTPMELFDRDFPGQYSRLIKNVKVTTVALVPPAEGIKATLVNPGISRAVVSSNNGVFNTVAVVKSPETIAFTGTQNASGVLELQPLNDKLVPFEGLGVDTVWQLTMPKFNNFFDYDTIGDVLITIDYTALEDNQYKQQVLRKLGTEVQFNRVFSMKNEFPDQWYDMSNAQNLSAERMVNFTVSKTDFPANVTVNAINEVGVMFVTDDDKTINAFVNLNFSKIEADGEVKLENGTQLSSAGNATKWLAFCTNKEPFGNWSLTLKDNLSIPAVAGSNNEIEYKTIEEYFAEDRIKDILFVLTYGGEVTQHPEMVNLKP